MTSGVGPAMILGGIVLSLFTWTRLARRDERLVLIYVAGLVGGFIGAKLVYVFAEGWLDWPLPDRWLRLATGKSVLGALLGGYASVEIAKRALDYRERTGDLFAIIAPLGIAIGRVGCLLNGCCLGRVCAPAWYTLRDARGVPRWPAVPVEFGFNVLALLFFLALRARRRPAQGAPVAAGQGGESSPSRAYALHGQHFHLYLIAYGLFRLFHEYWRATPEMAGGVTGYQVAALACVGLGGWGWSRRRVPEAGMQPTC